MIIMPKPHAYLQTMTKDSANFKLIGIKLYEDLRTQCTHRMSSNDFVEKGKYLRKENADGKKGQLIFHADTIYKILVF